MKQQASQWFTVGLAFAFLLFVLIASPGANAGGIIATYDQPEQWKRNPCMGGYKWKCLPRYAAQPIHDEPLQWKCHWIKRGVRSCKR
jgi:hypothetical protein